MLYNQSPNPSLGSSTSSVSWMISFGDLLTLLVCFFLLLTPQVNSGVLDPEPNQEVNSSRDQRHSIGTDLASKVFVVKDAPLEVMPIWRSREKEGVSGGKLVDQQWRSDMLKRVAAGSKARIEMCDVLAEREILTETLKDLRGSDVQASRVQFELGANCDRWRGKFPSDRELLAVVSFSGN